MHQFLASALRSDRNGHNHPPCPPAHSANRRPHTRSRSQPIVNQNHSPPRNLHRWPPFAIQRFPPLHLLPLALDHVLKLLLRNVPRPHNMLIQHDTSAARDRPHRQLFLSRYAQLAHHQDVQRQIACPRDFKCNRHASAHQPQHHRVLQVGKGSNKFPQPPPRLPPILKHHFTHAQDSMLVS